MRRPVALAVCAMVAVFAFAQPASASTHHHHNAEAANAVSLLATPGTVTYGDSVTLSGATDPPTAGDTIDVRDAADALVASTTTAGDGTFSTSFTPETGVELHAVWQGLDSPPVTVGVRAVVSAHLGNVRLFDSAVATGTVQPAREDAAVTVRLLHDGKVVATRMPTQSSSGSFRTSFAIEDPGSFRVRASFAAPDLLQGSSTTHRRRTPLPKLHKGSSGLFVGLLERRLVALHYHLTGVNRRFDARTADAVVALRKVQRLPRTRDVTATVWRALAHPHVIHPVLTTRKFHIEIDQSRQVLATVSGGTVRAIIHVSTGKPSTPTIDGTFRVNRKIAGYSPNRLYYPSYFDGNRAIHGWPDVPTYAASHGCVRVPYWTAKWIFRLAKLGTKVIVHH
jgi:hypothetical protein